MHFKCSHCEGGALYLWPRASWAGVDFYHNIQGSWFSAKDEDELSSLTA